MVLQTYPTEPPSSRPFYTGQRIIQTLLCIVAVICVPWMLLGKPIYRIMMNKKRANVSITSSKCEDRLDLNDAHQVFVSGTSCREQ